MAYHGVDGAGRPQPARRRLRLPDQAARQRARLPARRCRGARPQAGGARRRPRGQCPARPQARRGRHRHRRRAGLRGGRPHRGDRLYGADAGSRGRRRPVARTRGGRHRQRAAGGRRAQPRRPRRVARLRVADRDRGRDALARRHTEAARRRIRRHGPFARADRQAGTSAAYRVDRRLGRPERARHASHAVAGTARGRGALPDPEVRGGAAARHTGRADRRPDEQRTQRPGRLRRPDPGFEQAVDRINRIAGRGEQS